MILADLVLGDEIESVGVIFRDDAYGQGLTDAFVAAFGGGDHEHADGTVHVHEGEVTTASYSADGQPSYLSELEQAADGGAEWLVAIGFQEEAKIFIRESIENGVFTQFYFVDGTKSQELIDEIGGEFLDGFIGHRAGQRPGIGGRARVERRVRGRVRRAAVAAVRA